MDRNDKYFIATLSIVLVASVLIVLGLVRAFRGTLDWINLFLCLFLAILNLFVLKRWKDGIKKIDKKIIS